jgi:2-keto-3-deoxy-L-rhamnonate aldolase RhmA
MYTRQPNKVVEKFRKGEQSIGMQMYISSLEIYEAIGWAGFDFAMIDMEHTRINFETLVNIIRVCEMTEMTPFVRVPSPDAVYVRYALEAGARGIIVPHVKSAADVKKAQGALRFPPEGRAGVCPAVRSARYMQPNWEDYMHDSNANTSFIALFEDVEAVENVDEILAALRPGRDGYGLGLADISHALLKEEGEAVNWQHPYCKEAKEIIIPKAHARGVFNLGMAYASTPEVIQAVIQNDKTDAVMFHPDIALFQSMLDDIKKSFTIATKK